jgi:hypothetical protein
MFASLLKHFLFIVFWNRRLFEYHFHANYYLLMQHYHISDNYCVGQWFFVNQLKYVLLCGSGNDVDFHYCPVSLVMAVLVDLLLNCIESMNLNYSSVYTKPNAR